MSDKFLAASDFAQRPFSVQRFFTSTAFEVTPIGDAPVADDAGGDADPERSRRPAKAGRRGDGHEATAPEQMPMTVGLPRRIHSTIVQVSRRSQSPGE